MSSPVDSKHLVSPYDVISIPEVELEEDMIKW